MIMIIVMAISSTRLICRTQSMYAAEPSISPQAALVSRVHATRAVLRSRCCAAEANALPYGDLARNEGWSNLPS